MKRRKISAFLALTLAASMMLGACGSGQTSGTENNGGNTENAGSEVAGNNSENSAPEYIAAPYSIDAEKKGPTEYLEPKFYENGSGEPTIGVTLVGVIKQDGKYFKDSDNDKELDVFEDWRLDDDTRIADLLTKLNTQQRVGLLANQLACSPKAAKAEDVYDENGKVILSQLMAVTEDAFNAYVEKGESVDLSQAGGIGGLKADGERANSTGEMLTYESRSGVLRSTTDAETGALWNNAVNMTAEYAAVAKNEPTIPFIIIRNPDTVINTPGTLGMAAAVMGNGAENGDYSLIEKYADLNRQIWDAKGITRMYGPQIDLVTDPRWSRNYTTYTEVPEVMAGIGEALVKGYQTGTDGIQDGDVALIMKHFPGDGAAYNGFESHYPGGAYRVYQTEGSLEKYQLVGFQAVIDAGVAGIMPGYSMPAEEGTYGSIDQSYKGVELDPQEIANAYNDTILGTLLKDTMGFDGFINTDSGVITMGMDFGTPEDMTDVEKIADVINSGSDVIGDSFSGVNWGDYKEAVESGAISAEALDRANGNILKACMQMGQFENPYKDVAESKAAVDGLASEITAISEDFHQKSVVLLKNHNNVLPLKDTGKKVYIASFTAKGADDATVESWKAAFEDAGYTVVSKAEEADIAFLSVVPGSVAQENKYMNIIDLVDGVEVDEVDTSVGQVKTGNKVDVTTLQDVEDIKEIADTVHGNGGIVIGSVRISNQWILTNLEPYCDGLIAEFSTSVAAQMNVLTGAYNPTGKLPVTMTRSNEVIAIDENGLCVSPNDVPGYDKDQYISDDLKDENGKAFAYRDADGNYYEAWFGLNYN